MSEPRVRLMAAEDLDPVLALAERQPQAPHWARRAYRALFNPQALPKRIALVVELESAVRGFAVASIVGPEAELECIVVAAGFERRGLGRGLMQALSAMLHAAGVEELLLEVRQGNERALAFYSTLGWAEVGRRPRYYTDPEEDAILMSIRLA